MKSKLITVDSAQHDPVVERMLTQKQAEMNELARTNAKHLAEQNRPNPVGDKLAPYVAEIKAGYGQVRAKALHYLQPGAHLPEGKMEDDFLNKKVKQLDSEIKTRGDQNKHDKYTLGNYHPGALPLQVWIAGLATIILSIGEAIFNTKSFQITGESLLFSLILSIAISCGVLIASHLAAHLYKSAGTRLKRWLVVIISLFLVTTVFTTLAIFRSNYLASRDVNINPSNFVILNLFFFIVSSLLSFFIVPSWTEIKEQFNHLKRYSAIRKRNREIRRLKKEKKKIDEAILLNKKYRARMIFFSKYIDQRIRKMCTESIEIFKGTNLIFRTDGKTPDCYSDLISELDIEDVDLTFLPKHRLQ